jgi:hypothetical protein
MILELCTGGLILGAVYMYVHKSSITTTVTEIKTVPPTLTTTEGTAVASAVVDAQSDLSLFAVGKEDIIAEYERLKLRVEALVGVASKTGTTIPIAPSVSQAVITPVQTEAQTPPSITQPITVSTSIPIIATSSTPPTGTVEGGI